MSWVQLKYYSKSYFVHIKVIIIKSTWQKFIRSSSPRLDELPEDVAYEFTYGGRAQLFHYYYKLKNPDRVSTPIWTIDQIEDLKLKFRSNSLFGGYGVEAVKDISRHIDTHMQKYVSWRYR